MAKLYIVIGVIVNNDYYIFLPEVRSNFETNILTAKDL